MQAAMHMSAGNTHVHTHTHIGAHTHTDKETHTHRYTHTHIHTQMHDYLVLRGMKHGHDKLLKDGCFKAV